MRRRALRLLILRSRREEGQALILTAAALVVLIGFAALVIDIGRLYVAQRQLQQAVDAAALAAGQNLPHALTGYTSAVDYSAAPTEYNQHPTSMSANAPTITFKCLKSLTDAGLPCATDLDRTSCHPAGSAPPVTETGAATTTCNAVKVTESASVSTSLLHLFLPSGFTTVAASSTAAARGGVPHPLDIMVVLDATGSMATACGDAVQNEDGTQAMTTSQFAKIDCAKDGVRRLLKGLLPCQESVIGNCGFSPPLDEVGLEVFPGLKNPGGFDHSTDTNANHTNAALELNVNGTQCAGNLAAKPAWYTPNGTFPRWFLTWPNDLGYPADEVQTITFSAGTTGGTFTLSYGGSNTGPIAYKPNIPPGQLVTALTVQNALNGLPSISSVGGNVLVTGNAGGPFTVMFMGGLSELDVAPLGTAGTALTPAGHTVTVTETTKGNANADYLLTGGLSNDFKVSNFSTTLNPASKIAQAVTWDACTPARAPIRGGAPPNSSYYGANVGGFTYYAGAISLAQAVLASDSSRNAQPVIILLSDGDANQQPNGPNPCNQGIAAAQAAANAGTWVYSIAYSASTTSGCSLDTGITGFEAMRQMARSSTNPNSPDPSKFYCIPVPAGQNCNTAATLAQVFASIGVDLTDARLITDQ